MKIILATLSLLISVSTLAQSISTDIDPKRLDEVSAWVNSAKLELDQGIEDISKLEIPNQERAYAQLVEKVLKISGTKPNEFLMRNMLYRTQVVYKAIQNTPSSPKRDAYARRVLEEGTKWALTLYEADRDLLNQIKTSKDPNELIGVSFINLGLRWADYMFNLYYAAPENSSKFLLMKDLLGLLYNDINNDSVVNRILAPISNKIVLKHNELKNYNPKNATEELSAARSLRQFIEQHISETKNIISNYPDIYKKLVPFDAYNLRLQVLSSIGFFNDIQPCASLPDIRKLFYNGYLERGMIIRILEPIKWGDKLDYNRKVLFRLEESSPLESGILGFITPGCTGTFSFEKLIRDTDYKLNDKNFKPISDSVTFNNRNGITQTFSYLINKKTLLPYERECSLIHPKTKLKVSSTDVITHHFFIIDTIAPIRARFSNKIKFIPAPNKLGGLQIYNYVEIISDNPKFSNCKGYMLNHNINMVGF